MNLIFTFSEKVEELQISVDKLSRDSQLYKTSSTEMQIKLDTLQHYFRQQETELHRYVQQRPTNAFAAVAITYNFNRKLILFLS